MNWKLIVMFSCSLLAGGFVSVHAQTTNFVTLDQNTGALLRTALQHKWWETLGSTVVGGLLAIAGGFLATVLAHNLQIQRKEREQLEFTNNLLRVFRSDLDVLHDIYDHGIGKMLNELPANQLFMYRLALTEDWFSVFNSNAVHLGRIRQKISVQVIQVYGLIKRLIEEYRINNEYIKQFEDAEMEGRQRPDNAQVLGKIELYRRLIIEQTQRIKEADRALKLAKEGLFTSLDQRGIN